MERIEKAWVLSWREVVRELQVNKNTGLSSQEEGNRLEQVGSDSKVGQGSFEKLRGRKRTNDRSGRIPRGVEPATAKSSKEGYSPGHEKGIGRKL